MARRILVTGNAGAGKTTLARRLGVALDLPVHALDSIVWRRGWQKAPAEAKTAAIRALAALPAWVVDGVSVELEAAADLVVFLDRSPSACLRRSLGRCARAPLRTRPELPDGCPEALIAHRVPGIVLRFHRRVRPALLARAAQAPSRYRHVRSPAQLAAVLAELRLGNDGPAPVVDGRRPRYGGGGI